ncbi:MAG: sporulation protein YqfD [Turicibacter sp.]|nr:sporulation protein YqfD [Turicibacter sp.]
MNNKWLSIFIAKVQIIVPSMTDVTKLRRQNIMIYGVKKHEEGYLVTIRKDVAKQLESQHPIASELSIYPSILKIILPIVSLTFLLMILMSQYTIGYRIDGNLNHQEQQELEELIEPHFKKIGPFHFLSDDLDNIKTELEAYYNDYVWINIYRKGTDIVFDVYNTPIDESNDLDAYSDTLYAKRSGLIKNYNVSSCRVLVEQNQVVKAGDPLVTCYVEQPYTTEIIPIEDTAKGEVWADTWYEAIITADKSYVEEGFTANKQTNYVLHIGGFEFSFPSKEVTYEKYEEVVKEYDPFFFMKESPIYLEKRQYYEKSDIIKVNTSDELKDNLLILIKNKFKEQTDGEFIIKNLEIISEEETDTQFIFKCHLTIYENIAY